MFVSKSGKLSSFLLIATYRKYTFKKKPNELQLNVFAHLVVHAGGVVHGLHPALGDAPDVDLLLALGQLRQALAVVREVGHRVVVGVPAEWLKHQH